MSNFISIDPGSPTGAAVFDPEGRLVLASQIVYEGAIEYISRLRKAGKKHEIEFALIEQYYRFQQGYLKNAHKVQAQIQLLQETFPNHIMVHTGEWNPMQYRDRAKRELCQEIFKQPFLNSHIRDAALMGYKCFQKVRYETGAQAFTAMKHRAMSVRKWPTLKDLSWLAWWEKYQRECEQKEMRFRNAG